jgi:hypothetical protein
MKPESPRPTRLSRLVIGSFVTLFLAGCSDSATAPSCPMHPSFRVGRRRSP